MEEKKFVEVELTEKTANARKCDNGCQRNEGAPTGG